jgi:uncharacterized SAM-binding protein YcdF (DUF218 family)
MTADLHRAALAVWNYHRLAQSLAPADLIFVLGSHDLRVAERAAELYLAKFAPRVVLSGGFGALTRAWEKPEAELFAEVLRSRSVPDSVMILESRSTNTGENVRFTRQLLAERGMKIQSLIAVQKPYMERRTFATLRAQWPEVAVQVTSPQLDFNAYCAGSISRDSVINIMVGDLQRIIEYPQRGFMIPQEVPTEVQRALETLIAAGYTQHLIKA